MISVSLLFTLGIPLKKKIVARSFRDQLVLGFDPKGANPISLPVEPKQDSPQLYVHLPEWQQKISFQEAKDVFIKMASLFSKVDTSNRDWSTPQTQQLKRVFGQRMLTSLGLENVVSTIGVVPTSGRNKAVSGITAEGPSPATCLGLEKVVSTIGVVPTSGLNKAVSGITVEGPSTKTKEPSIPCTLDHKLSKKRIDDFVDLISRAFDLEIKENGESSVFSNLRPTVVSDSKTFQDVLQRVKIGLKNVLGNLTFSLGDSLFSSSDANYLDLNPNWDPKKDPKKERPQEYSDDSDTLHNADPNDPLSLLYSLGSLQEKQAKQELPLEKLVEELVKKSQAVNIQLLRLQDDRFLLHFKGHWHLIVDSSRITDLLSSLRDQRLSGVGKSKNSEKNMRRENRAAQEAAGKDSPKSVEGLTNQKLSGVLVDKVKKSTLYFCRVSDLGVLDKFSTYMLQIAPDQVSGFINQV